MMEKDTEELLDSKKDYSTELDLYKIYQSRIYHEDDLLNHRTTWYLQSNAFLITAFVAVLVLYIKEREGFSLHLLIAIPIVGSMLDIASVLSLISAVKAIRGVEKQWHDIKLSSIDYFTVPDKNSIDIYYNLDYKIAKRLPRLTNGMADDDFDGLPSYIGAITVVIGPFIFSVFWIFIDLLIYISYNKPVYEPLHSHTYI